MICIIFDAYENHPDDLIKSVMKLTGTKTKNEAVNAALREMLQSEKRKQLINFGGKIDLGIDLDTLRDRK